MLDRGSIYNIVTILPNTMVNRYLPKNYFFIFPTSHASADTENNTGGTRECISSLLQASRIITSKSKSTAIEILGV